MKSQFGRPVPRRALTRDDRARIIATVLAGFEEISGARITMEAHYHMILEKLLGNQFEDDSEIFRIWRKTSRRLADSRTNEFPRTCFAISVYIFGLVAAFVPSIGGGNESPAGGRIAGAIFISWLIPLALLSNTMGTFTSRRTCLDIMSDFVEAATKCNYMDLSLDSLIDANAGSNSGILAPNEQEREGSRPASSDTTIHLHGHVGDIDDATWLLVHQSWNQYFDSLHWLGSIYTHRPWKVMSLAHDPHTKRTNVVMALCSFFPVCMCAVASFIIMYYAVPVGFSCRSIWVVCFFALYIVSVALTTLLYRRCGHRFTGHTLWRMVLIKDLIIAIGTISTIFLSTAGLFNTCWCWTRAIFLGKDHGSWPMNSDADYEENTKNYYSISVGLCLGAHVVFYLGLVLWFRRGIKVVRWTESRRRVEWEHEMPQRMAQLRQDNYLLL